MLLNATELAECPAVAEIIRMRQSVDDVANATIKRDLTALSSVLNYAIARTGSRVIPCYPSCGS
jgi:hypothetical protein